MATGFLSPIGNGQQWFSDQGVVLAGGQIFTYIAGTTTPAATYTTSTLSVSNPNPIILNSSGRAPQEIWLQQGATYKFVVTDSNGNVLSVGTFDNISGINDTSNQNSVSEWIVSGSTPTYVSPTQFTVPGNQVATFQINRRVYGSVSAGAVYGSITGSSYSAPNTTVTVAWDSGALDSGLTAVAYALLNATNPSVPANEFLYKGLANVQIFSTAGAFTYTPQAGTNRAIIEMVGGGGAGGGAVATAANQGAAGSGGSAGSYLKLLIPSGLQGYAGTSITVGAAGVGSAGANGGAGGASLIGAAGALASAAGGPGGIAGTNFALSTGATSVTADRGSHGAASTTTLTLISSSNGAVGELGLVGSAAYGGNGGNSKLGLGGRGQSFSSGAGGTGPGAGGGSSANQNSTAQSAGYSGGVGLIIFYEYL